MPKTIMKPNIQPESKSWQISNEINLTGFEWQNDKPLALLSHANGFCAATWSPVVQHLLPHYHVIAFDFRGHGGSSTPAAPDGYRWQNLVDDMLLLTRTILTAKGEQQVALAAGSSLGGVITAAAASEQPALFRRIVMLDPPVLPHTESVKRLGLETPAAMTNPGSRIGDQARRRRAIWPSRAAAVEKWRNKPMFTSWDEDAFDQYIKYGFRDRLDGSVELSCPPEVEAAIFDQTGDLNIFDRANAISCPITVVHAAGGHFPKALYKELARLCPQGDFASIDGGWSFTANGSAKVNGRSVDYRIDITTSGRKRYLPEPTGI